MSKIINWKTNQTIIEDSNLSIKELAEKAVKYKKYKISLAYTVLISANLEGANLEGTCLYKADLKNANLKEANIEDTDLVDADLRGADLRHAKLKYANLEDANIRGIKINKDQKDDLLKAMGVIIK